MGKVEQDTKEHLDQMDIDDEREGMVDMLAKSIIEDNRMRVLFDEELVFFAMVDYVQSLMNDADQGTVEEFFKTMKDEIEKEAEKTADKLLKEDGR